MTSMHADDKGYSLLVLVSTGNIALVEFDGQNAFALCLFAGRIKNHRIRLKIDVTHYYYYSYVFFS